MKKTNTKYATKKWAAYKDVKPFLVKYYNNINNGYFIPCKSL